MAISNTQKSKVLKIINVFETGDPNGKYDSISIYKDATNKQGEKMYQITYGRSQTTEFGNLKRLLELYMSRDGRFSALFQGYISKIGKEPALHTNAQFKQLLRQAAREDIIMRASQDEFFDMYYYQPAFVWYRGFGFTEALSLLVIYDSFIHSGTVPDFLRKRFAERLPLNGGQEKA
ncbi:lysozyme family protein [Adhaeribacter pallidiroseus]|uniref:Chitosanase n=1 Tax=Adhaeribacter pallidiroseus TaxID=2072847 RepID=A0A369QH25_9BACT|nr:hypothetical protein [Adhaeribacter pallidiroseus]RDC62875.1 Chitosanase [Adhaeribacter pallidiroseus]